MARPKESMVAEIKEKTKQFLENREHANNVIDILEYIENEETSVVIAAIKATYKIFTSLLTQNQVLCERVEGKKQTASQKYKLWLFERYIDGINSLLTAIKATSSNVQELALCTLMKFVVLESKHPVKRNSQGETFPVALFNKIIDSLLSRDIDRRKLLGRFQEYIEYDDVRYYLLDKISVKAAYLKKNLKTEDLNTAVLNIFTVLEQISRAMPAYSEEGLTNFLTKMPSAESQISPASKCKNHQRVFENAWLSFLQLPLPSSVYKKVLMLIHGHIIPHMRSPLLLIDFLTASYDMGGAISLLALNGVFILIHKHNLEYPDFFKKLYSLLNPSIFHVKYKARFFYLTDLFLMSTHIPSYLVAAFAKKLSRLALTAPPTGILLVIPLVCNLIKRHPNVALLINRPDGPTDITTDPYNVEEPDLSKCGAMDSSLWELKTLQSHYFHQVATSASKIDKPFPKEEWEIGELLELKHSELVEQEVKKKMKKVPLEFEVPAGLFGGKDDTMRSLWTL
ncbi:nucleolar complex protein 4 homolog B-like [Ptychodera flava]|uniref:nucleolar complex protein 4 homolog B-like n=1 Tax=Ptychodera flava TaxID=63121 RepID=UPI003969D9FC